MNITEMQEKHLPALAELEKQCFHAPWSEKMLRERRKMLLLHFRYVHPASLPMMLCTPALISAAARR